VRRGRLFLIQQNSRSLELGLASVGEAFGFALLQDALSGRERSRKTGNNTPAVRIRNRQTLPFARAGFAALTRLSARAPAMRMRLRAELSRRAEWSSPLSASAERRRPTLASYVSRCWWEHSRLQRSAREGLRERQAAHAT
jgi:hypothetical protein